MSLRRWLGPRSQLSKQCGTPIRNMGSPTRLVKVRSLHTRRRETSSSSIMSRRRWLGPRSQLSKQRGTPIRNMGSPTRLVKVRSLHTRRRETSSSSIMSLRRWLGPRSQLSKQCGTPIRNMGSPTRLVKVRSLHTRRRETSSSSIMSRRRWLLGLKPGLVVLHRRLGRWQRVRTRLPTVQHHKRRPGRIRGGSRCCFCNFAVLSCYSRR